MTVSRIYKMTVGELVEQALRDAKIIPAQQPVSDYDYQTGIRSLNNVSKYIQTLGLHQWLMRRAVLPLVPSKQSYSLGPNGDPCGYADSFYATQLANGAAAGDDYVELQSVNGIEPAPGLLESSPVVSTQDWTPNAATLSISAGLRVTNNSAAQGSATYVLPTEIGKTYRIKFSYLAGTSAGCTFSVMNGLTVADTVTLSVDGDAELLITAQLQEITFRIQNDSAVNGQYSTLSALQYMDNDSGSRIGIQVAGGSMEWRYIIAVDEPNSQVQLNAPLMADASANNIVYSFSEQIDRPLQIFNATYAWHYLRGEIPVQRWARQEYMQQPMKSSRGTVVSFYYNPSINEGELFVWETAQMVGNTLQFDVRVPTAVYTHISDELDYPSEYYNALRWLIAADIGPGYGAKPDQIATAQQNAAVFLSAAADNDNELDSVLVQPNFTG